MVSEIFERTAAITIVKVANPASYGGVDFVHNPSKRFYSSRSLREFGNSIFDNLQEFLRWLHMGVQLPTFPAFTYPN